MRADWVGADGTVTRLPGRISLNRAISAMCSDVKMIFPFPQHGWGKRPLEAPSRSHASVQRMRAAASAGSKNSRSTLAPKEWLTTLLFMNARDETNMTAGATSSAVSKFAVSRALALDMSRDKAFNWR